MTETQGYEYKCCGGLHEHNPGCRADEYLRAKCLRTRILINRHKVKANAKHGTDEPVLSVKTYKGTQYGHEVDVKGPSRLVYRPDKPLSCGARVWIVTESPVVLNGKVVNKARR